MIKSKWIIFMRSLLIPGIIIALGYIFYWEASQYFPVPVDRSKEFEQKIDSLNSQIISERQQWKRDSLEFVEILNKNNKTINRLLKDVDEVNFEDYSDDKLDSIVKYLYPTR